MYGEVTAALHTSMTQLLAMRRPSFFLGGANGNRPATTTPAERLAATAKILRYRKVIWDYALALAETATPIYASDGWEAPRRLLHWLQKDQPTAAALPGGRGVNTAELASVQDTRLSEAWRLAAVAAMAGRERELPNVADRIRLDGARVLMRDAADLTWALISLDARYFPLPGWQRLSTKSKWQDAYSTKAPHLVDSALSAAQLCSSWAAGVSAADAAAVDRLGYRAPTALMPVPYPFGFDGAIAAQHNLFVRLGAEFPSADSLTAVVRAQRVVSALAARAASDVGADDQATRFGRRAENYQTLLAMLMGRVAGPLGRGRSAVDDAQAAQTAMEDAVGTGERASDDQLAWLRRLFMMTDAYVAARTRQGIEQRRYFVWNEFTLSGVDLGGMKRAVRKYEPIDGRNHPNLYAAVKALAPAGESARLVDGGPQRDEFTRIVETAGELDRARRYGARPTPAMAPGIAGRDPRPILS
ncbi:hypothetical protein ET495_09965 [Xylanimonas allomyrinae]|uniref:Uncharacterized protein n=1 Tax=Xylanimonas allomyrinae TaxID=2509459 RepID=A0A4P6EZL6_9MICO|nr:hypothetical protein [Xylanimonas allomyrinae]QAY63518.1 hypothetical protein ET495_09965 [Xylanimonas allomyrinae]